MVPYILLEETCETCWKAKWTQEELRIKLGSLEQRGSNAPTEKWGSITMIKPVIFTSCMMVTISWEVMEYITRAEKEVPAPPDCLPNKTYYSAQDIQVNTRYKPLPWWITNSSGMLSTICNMKCPTTHSQKCFTMLYNHFSNHQNHIIYYLTPNSDRSVQFTSHVYKVLPAIEN